MDTTAETTKLSADVDECAPGCVGGAGSATRASTAGQLLDRQIHALRRAGCARIFAEKLSRRAAGVDRVY